MYPIPLINPAATATIFLSKNLPGIVVTKNTCGPNKKSPLGMNGLSTLTLELESGILTNHAGHPRSSPDNTKRRQHNNMSRAVK